MMAREHQPWAQLGAAHRCTQAHAALVLTCSIISSATLSDRRAFVHSRARRPMLPQCCLLAPQLSKPAEIRTLET